jgi:GTPase SAR1 family protein
MFFKKKDRQVMPEQLDETIQSNAVLRVIGDRASGKTTYLAALARWPNAESSGPIQSVIPLNEDGEELISQARNLLEQGLRLEPSALTEDAEQLKDYSLQVILKEQFPWTNPQANLKLGLTKLNINCKDYAGEFFSDLLHQPSTPQLVSYMEDCLQATGLLLLVDGTSYRLDSEYVKGIDKLLTTLENFKSKSSKLRIAMVLTKCEQPELWTNRFKPEETSKNRFPKVCQRLETWKAVSSGSVDYFATSAFGVIGNQRPEPNSKRIDRNELGTQSIIKDPKKWQPFGLISPIYWLCTGKRNPNLDRT